MGQIPKFWKQKNPAKIRNVDKEFAKELDFKALKFPIQKEKKKKKKKRNMLKQKNKIIFPLTLFRMGLSGAALRWGWGRQKDSPL